MSIVTEEEFPGGITCPICMDEIPLGSAYATRTLPAELVPVELKVIGLLIGMEVGAEVVVCVGCAVASDLAAVTEQSGGPGCDGL